MPELPEVQTIVVTLAQRLSGRTIAAVRLLRQDIITPRDVDFPKYLTGRRISAIARRGKRILFTLDNDRRFYIHLGMTGRLTIQDLNAAAPHTHLILAFDAGPALHFTDPRRFGGVVWLGTESPDRDLGPEPLTLRPAQLGRQLARTTRPVKAALLDQHLIAGLGNIYADESLHTAGIHPLLAANRLNDRQIHRLNRAIKSTLRNAIRHGGSTLRDYRSATGEKGNFQAVHRVYGRGGEPCRRCGGPIQRIVVAGRSTCFCPNCQTGSG